MEVSQPQCRQYLDGNCWKAATNWWQKQQLTTARMQQWHCNSGNAAVQWNDCCCKSKMIFKINSRLAVTATQQKAIVDVVSVWQPLTRVKATAAVDLVTAQWDVVVTATITVTSSKSINNQLQWWHDSHIVDSVVPSPKSWQQKNTVSWQGKNK